MILKEKQLNTSTTDKRLLAGEQQEKDLAFYLRRAFKDRDEVLVINDLRILYKDEIAQIDHLVITELGFCLIESKSIKATVKINKAGEWSRSYKGYEKGIPSPIKQVELQEKLLKDLMDENRHSLIGKILGMQQGFGGRKWLSICAVSSDAVIQRKNLPEALNTRIIKSEFVVDWIEENLALRQGIGKRLRTLHASTPMFTMEELTSIGKFLIGQHTPLKLVCPDKPQIEEGEVVQAEKDDHVISCKSCGSKDSLKGAYGRYGYYVQCACGTNTSMKKQCPSCLSEMKTKKNKNEYTAYCSCGETLLIFTEKEIETA